MKKAEIRIGAIYSVKVSGKLVPVRIVAESPQGGWIGRNEVTGRDVRIRTARRLRRAVEAPPSDEDRNNHAGHHRQGQS
jgi:hypothetical protein